MWMIELQWRGRVHLVRLVFKERWEAEERYKDAFYGNGLEPFDDMLERTKDEDLYPDWDRAFACWDAECEDWYRTIFPESTVHYLGLWNYRPPENVEYVYVEVA